MQRIPVYKARRSWAEKRGGGTRTVAFQKIGASLGSDPGLLLDLDEALARPAVENPPPADVAHYHLLAGLSIGEVAEARGVSRAKAFVIGPTLDPGGV